MYLPLVFLLSFNLCNFSLFPLTAHYCRACTLFFSFFMCLSVGVTVHLLVSGNTHTHPTPLSFFSLWSGLVARDERGEGAEVQIGISHASGSGCWGASEVGRVVRSLLHGIMGRARARPGQTEPLEAQCCD